MPLDPSTDVFEMQRPRLLRLAYRMLGSHSEAEDIVQ
ncbi:MAG: sigma factor, partial [Shinella sp.]